MQSSSNSTSPSDLGTTQPCILVVEDDFLVRMVTVDALEDMGCRVAEAASATEAVSKVDKDCANITAAVIDVGLPDRKGDDLAAELRRMCAGLPIVIVSGYGEAELQPDLAGDAKVRLLGKPYQSNELAASLQSLGVAVGDL